MKARILHVFGTLPVGGAENLLLSILKGLDAERYESVVCTLGKAGVLSNSVKAMGIPFVELDVMRKGASRREIVVAVENLIRQEEIDLVHSHLYHANYYARLAARRVGVKAVASIHNTYNHPKLHRRVINWWLSRETHALIVGSEEIRRDVCRYDWVLESKLEVIPNSVDLDRSLPVLSKKRVQESLSLPKEVLVLGTIGRLETQKGHRVLLDAIALLKDRLPLVLLLIGSGREEAALRQQAKTLGISEQIIFLGTRGDLGDLFQVMDLFVMPSLWEGLSLAMLSAMAAGLPVLATNVGGVASVLGQDERGWVVPPGSPEALASTIEVCTRNLDVSIRRALLGRDYVHANFSDQAMVCRIEAVYERVLRMAS